MEKGPPPTPPLLSHALRGLGDRWLEHLEELLRVAPFGVYVDDPTLGCIYANRALLENFGVEWEEFRGFGWARRVLPEDAERLQRAIEEYEHDRGTIDVTYRVRGRDDRIRWVHARVSAVLDDEGRHVASLGLTRDATAEREQRERSVTTQKREAIGTLSAQLAHDFNNLLTVMIAGVDLMGPEVQSEVAREQLVAVEQAFEQARQLTRQLLLLSGRGSRPSGTCLVDDELARLAPLLQSTVGEGVELELDLRAPDGHIPIGETQLGQIALNLAANGRDAMKGHGRLRLSSTCEEKRVRLVVEDSGSGMTPEVLARAKEPFFTTKDAGRGSGLGLATVDDLTRLVGGALSLESEPGRGTRVTLELPRVGPNPYVEARAAAPAATDGESSCVLLIEDNDAVRQSLAYALAMAGHRVLAANSVGEARRLLAEEPDVDVVLTDVMLGDGYGTELAKELRAQRPDLPIVFTSGFAGEAEAAAMEESSVTRFVPKPFHSLDVLRAMGEVLGHPPA